MSNFAMYNDKFDYSDYGQYLDHNKGNTNPVVVCPDCNRTHQRAYCPWCHRENNWKKRTIQKQLPGLSARLYKIIPKLRDFEHPILPPRSCFCFGKPGTGKSMFALKVLHEQTRMYALQGRDYRSFAFISVPDMFAKMKQQISCGGNEYELLDKYRQAKWLVLDDLGIVKNSSWEFNILYLIINHRYEHLLPTIITSNFDLIELAQMLDDERITRRIAEMMEQIEFTQIK